MIEWDKFRSPRRLAKKLWHTSNLRELARLPPDRFQALFNQVYLQTDELYALWQLAGATNDYLRANPGAVVVPPELPRRLIVSNQVDARAVGLKLLNRCSVSDAEIVQAMINALRRADGYESCGGLYELHNFLSGRFPNGVGLKASLAKELLSAVVQLANDDVESHSGAADAVICLKEFIP